MDNLDIEATLVALQQTDTLRLVIFGVIIVLFIVWNNRRSESRIREIQTKAEIDRDKWTQEQQQQSDARRDKERETLIQSQTTMFTRSFELIGDKFNTAIENIVQGNQHVVEAMESLIIRQQKSEMAMTAAIEKIPTFLGDVMGGVDLRYRTMIDDHNRQAMERYSAIEATLQSIQHYLEQRGDCPKELVQELTKVIETARDMIRLIPKPETPHPPTPPDKPTLIILDDPQTQPKDEDDEDSADDAQEQAA